MCHSVCGGQRLKVCYSFHLLALFLELPSDGFHSTNMVLLAQTSASNVTDKTCRTSVMLQTSTQSTQSHSIPSTEHSVPLVAMVHFTSGTKTPSTDSKATQRSEVQSVRPTLTAPATSLPMQYLTIGARAMRTTLLSWRTKSCSIRWWETSANPARVARRDDRTAWDKKTKA